MKKSTITKIIIGIVSIVVLVISLIVYDNREKPEPKVYNPPESYMINKENYFDYQDGPQCAAFSSAYLLRFFGEEVDGMELFDDYPNKAADGGVMPYGIENFFSDRGYEAEYVRNATIEELQDQISQGVPVIVFIHVKVPYTNSHNTHYVPVVGYDSEYLYLAESLEEYANCKDEVGVSYNRKVAYDEFVNLWKKIDNRWDNPYFKISK